MDMTIRNSDNIKALFRDRAKLHLRRRRIPIHISVAGRLYTFGAIGFDFYYSGDMADAFPFWPKRFIDDDGVALTAAQVDSIQSNVSNCSRPEKGLEYKQQENESSEPETIGNW